MYIFYPRSRLYRENDCNTVEDPLCKQLAIDLDPVLSELVVLRISHLARIDDLPFSPFLIRGYWHPGIPQSSILPEGTLEVGESCTLDKGRF